MAGMEDIAPALLEQLQTDFRERIQNSTKLKELLQLINEGKASYVEAEEFAHEAGTLLSQTFGKYITSATLPDGRMYYNIADRVLRPMLEEDHQLIAGVAQQVQQTLNQKANIGLKAQAATLNEDRIYGIVNKIAESEQFDDVAWMLAEPVINFSQAVVDDTLKANIDFQGRAGLKPKIIRKSERKCCEWCSALAGEYMYPDVPQDVYRRHERCRCAVEYDPGTGKRQNVHTKQFTQPQESAKIEARKVIGIRINGVTIQEVGAHAIDQMAARNVTMDAILDALTNPLDIKPVKYDGEGRPSFAVVGRRATATINPDTGKITTTYPTHTKTANKLLRKKGMK